MMVRELLEVIRAHGIEDGAEVVIEDADDRSDIPIRWFVETVQTVGGQVLVIVKGPQL